MKFITKLLLALLIGLPATVAVAQSPDAKNDDGQAYVRMAAKRVELAREEYDKANVATTQIRQSIREKTGRIDVERTSLERVANKLDQDLQTLELEQAGSHARIEAIEEAIAQQSKRVEKASVSDEVIAELQKVADARERQLKMVENERKTGAAPDAALQEAIAALAEARAKVAERRQVVFAGNGGDALTSLNRELMSLSISDRERRAKIFFLEAQLAKITPELSATRELEFQENMLGQAMVDLRREQQNLRQLQMDASETSGKPAAPQTKPAKSLF